MTLMEGIVAIAILAGVVTGCLEACKSAIARLAVTRLETQVALEADSLLRTVTEVEPIAVGIEAGVTVSGVHWTKTVMPVGAVERWPKTYQIIVEANAAESGVAVNKSFATTRLSWSGRRP
jgi:hypothetical protein